MVEFKTKKLIEQFIDTAEHYGFQNILLPKSKEGLSLHTDKIKTLPLVVPYEQNLIRALKKHIARNTLENSPTLLFDITSLSKKTLAELHVFGVENSIAEMILIATMATFLRENNIDNFSVNINSLGDRESKIKFLEDLQAYFKQYFDSLPQYAQTYVKAKNPVKALKALRDKEHPLTERAPNPLEYLNDESRSYLRDILEFMEYMDIAYELNPLLVGSTEIWHHTLFEITIPQDQESSLTIARGGRYDTIIKRISGKNFPSVGMIFETQYSRPFKYKTGSKNKKQPKLFISFISDLAKLHAFSVLESFYKAGIPLASAFVQESLSKQMKHAEKLQVPYVIIIGHKEALEEVAIVRNVATMAQKTVPLTKLPGYVKKLKGVLD